MTIKMVSVFVTDPIEAFGFYAKIPGFEELLYMPDAYLAIVKAPDVPGDPGLLLEPNQNPIAKTYQERLRPLNGALTLCLKMVSAT